MCPFELCFIFNLSSWLRRTNHEVCPFELYFIFNLSSWLRRANHEVCPFELLHGSTTITEYILGLKFQISPNSFFQGNTQCAELLYLTALDLGKVGIETTVLDICCGTGNN